MVESIAGSSWQAPARILLLTYSRSDHLLTSFDNSVVGVPSHRASITKAKKVRSGDWVMIRVSDQPMFLSAGPARVTGMPMLQKQGGPYPDLLWQEEVEASMVLFPLRIPVTFDGGPRIKAGCVSWESLAALGLRGKDGYRLDSPQQWGKKFTTNVLAAPEEVDAFIQLLVRCAV